MVAAHEETRHSLTGLADGLLSLFGRESPSTADMGAAMTVAEFVMRVNHFLTKG